MVLVSLVVGGTPASAMAASAIRSGIVDDDDDDDDDDNNAWGEERAANDDDAEKADETPKVALKMATVSEIFMVRYFCEKGG